MQPPERSAASNYDRELQEQADAVREMDETNEDRSAATLCGPHTVGKPCPEKPDMIVTTLDWQKNRCGACGRKLYATA